MYTGFQQTVHSHKIVFWHLIEFERVIIDDSSEFIQTVQW